MWRPDGVYRCFDVFKKGINTCNGGELVNPIKESDDEDHGVKVFMGNQGKSKREINEGELAICQYIITF
jgi:hypothetical protein